MEDKKKKIQYLKSGELFKGSIVDCIGGQQNFNRANTVKWFISLVGLPVQDKFGPMVHLVMKLVGFLVHDPSGSFRARRNLWNDNIY